MAKSTKSDRKLLEILVAVAWIDGEIQPEERKFIEKIAVEQNIESAEKVEDLLNSYQDSSPQQCYQLLEQYLGNSPKPDDYNNLLSAVSSLIYSDNDIATEEANFLTTIQNIDPQNYQKRSTLDKVIGKIQKLYVAGLGKG
jgi:uncharacterized tellurite resistance protein B-like protein